jgi:D-3-phosphoglycerate dehydrogenase
MIKILANDGIDSDGKLLLEDAGFHVDTEKVPQDELPKVLPNYDVILVRSATKVRKDLIEQCPNLKVIGRAGVGLDNIDVAFAKERGVTVLNTPAASSQAVAELTFAHFFSLARYMGSAARGMGAGEAATFNKLKKDFSSGIQLRGRTLGIVGFGRIGQETARIGLALGMRVLPVDLVVSEARIDLKVYGYRDIALSVKLECVSMDDMLRHSDFISLHVPSVGKALIGREEIAKMKKGAIIVNTARGGVIDEEAALEGLQSGQLGGVGLDVFLNEPTPRLELLNHPRISVSPHIGGSTVEAQRNIGLELAEKVIAHFDK